MYDTKLREELTELESAKLEIARLKMQIKLGKPVAQVALADLTEEVLGCFPSVESRLSDCSAVQSGWWEPFSEYLKFQGVLPCGPVEFKVWYAPEKNQVVIDLYDALKGERTQTRRDLC